MLICNAIHKNIRIFSISVNFHAMRICIFASILDVPLPIANQSILQITWNNISSNNFEALEMILTSGMRNDDFYKSGFVEFFFSISVPRSLDLILRYTSE